MPLLVNGRVVPESLIEQEINKVRFDPRWQSLPEEDRESMLREAADYAAVSQVLIEWTADNDVRPLDRREIEVEMQKAKLAGNCRSGFEVLTRKQVERGMRIRRIIEELIAEAEEPSLAEMENFFTANRDHFVRPGAIRASHIVRNVNEKQTEAEARAAIEAASVELEQGADFAIVAECFSDCKGNGGDLGEFAEGVMVEEFERALNAVEPGQITANLMEKCSEART